jgi:hypothetical protein
LCLLTQRFDVVRAGIKLRYETASLRGSKATSMVRRALKGY